MFSKERLLNYIGLSSDIESVPDFVGIIPTNTKPSRSNMEISSLTQAFQSSADFLHCNNFNCDRTFTAEEKWRLVYQELNLTFTS